MSRSRPTALITRPLDDCLIAVAVEHTPRHARRQRGKGIHVDRDGYARCWDPVRRRQVLAHRRVAAWAFGGLDDDAVVHHECGVRRCLNPSHLRVMARGEHAALHASLRREARAA